MSDSLIVSDTEVSFSNHSTGDITSYYWDFGDGNTSTEPNPAHTYTRRERFYTVTLTVTNELGQDTSTKQIEVRLPMKANFYAYPGRSTVGTVITFKDNSVFGYDIDAWLWDFGDGSTSTEHNPTHSYKKSGAYTVKLTVSNSASSDTLVKEKMITATTLDIFNVDMCTDVKPTGQRTITLNNKFYYGDAIWIFFEVRGFAQKQLTNGCEVWLDFNKISILNPNGQLIEVPEIIEFHGTIIKYDPALVMPFCALIAYVQTSDIAGKYDVLIQVTDLLTGDVSQALESFYIERGNADPTRPLLEIK